MSNCVNHWLNYRGYSPFDQPLMRQLVATFIALLMPCLVVAEELTPKQRDLFEKHVRPILVAHCIKCHGQSKQEANLRLTSLEELLKGGESGPAIVPGNADESLLLEALKYDSLEMPPDGRLNRNLISGIEKWIAAGAPWPRNVVLKPTPKITAKDREWWCYQPIADPTVPNVDDGGWCRNEIDRFVFARLAQAEIKPAAEANQWQLIRRVHFALTGLPPTLDQLSKSSTTDQASYESLVDQLLEDSTYGENQARFWLDLVRYAESDGYRADHARPEATKYRDYVIRSFNADKPYDRFVTEQLAGDEIDPGNRDALIATMFLRHWIYEWNQRDVETQWQEILDDITETTADVFLAQGLKCARCHDHKFDPLLQKDYYRLQAFFAAFQPREDMPVADLATRTAHFEKQQRWEQATKDIRRELYEIENPVLLKHSTREGVSKFVSEIQTMIKKSRHQRKPYEHQIAMLASRQFDVHPHKLSEWLDKDAESRRQQLRKKLAAFDDMKPKSLPTLKFVASDVGPLAPPTFIPDDNSQTPIEPGIPTLLNEQPAQIVPPPVALRSTGRRTALARWIVDAKNPLTARVMVNRIWQQHFGYGLAATSSDFGQLGQPPTHPELLDWLASRFIEDGWSIKKLHRRILTSATFRQSSQREKTERLATIDPNNQLLWRMNPRRLTGEEITDAILTASGQMKPGGRAIYRSVRRNKLDPLLAAFDMPDRIRSSGKRHQTTTPTQALLMTNGSWMHDRAQAMAAHISRSTKSTGQYKSKVNNSEIWHAYLALFGRRPNDDEINIANDFLAAYTSQTPVEKPPSNDKRLVAMPHTGSKAIVVSPQIPLRVSVPFDESLPSNDFTVEAIVMLRSLYKNASVRTIAAHWTGNSKHPGWSFGVTSEKSRYKPRNLILQLVGKTNSGDSLHYEVVPSNLRPELNKPYYLAASVKLGDTSERGITFYMKDLSLPAGKLHTAQVAHKVTRDIRPRNALNIGGRFGSHVWDGFIDRLQIHSEALTDTEIKAATSPNLSVDLRFEDKMQIGRDSSKHGNHATVGNETSNTKTPRQRAHIALIHALLNSNELIYVD